MADKLTATDDRDMAVAPDEIAPEMTDMGMPEAAADVPEESGPELEAEMPPAPVPNTPAPLDAIRLDAKSRAWRTLLQGALMAAALNVILVGYPYLQSIKADQPLHIDWQAVALVVLQAAGSAILAYLHKALGVGEK